MTDKNKLQNLLKQRITTPQREAVKPVNLYTKQGVKKVKPLEVKVVKYTTHLYPMAIKAIKQKALDTNKKDYEIVGEAIARYCKIKK